MKRDNVCYLNKLRKIEGVHICLLPTASGVTTGIINSLSSGDLGIFPFVPVGAIGSIGKSIKYGNCYHIENNIIVILSRAILYNSYVLRQSFKTIFIDEFDMYDPDLLIEFITRVSAQTRNIIMLSTVGDQNCINYLQDNLRIKSLGFYQSIYKSSFPVYNKLLKMDKELFNI